MGEFLRWRIAQYESMASWCKKLCKQDDYGVISEIMTVYCSLYVVKYGSINGLYVRNLKELCNENLLQARCIGIVCINWVATRILANLSTKCPSELLCPIFATRLFCYRWNFMNFHMHIYICVLNKLYFNFLLLFLLFHPELHTCMEN